MVVNAVAKLVGCPPYPGCTPCVLVRGVSLDVPVSGGLLLCCHRTGMVGGIGGSGWPGL